MKATTLILLAGLSVVGQKQTAFKPGGSFVEVKSVHQPAIKVITAYLKWYVMKKKDIEPLAADILDRHANDTTYQYKVNFAATEKYLAEIKKSGFVSENYVDYLRAFFRDCDADLKRYPRHEGPYPRLDDDVILRVQEDEDITEHLNEMVIVSQKTTLNHRSVVILIKSSRLELNFKLLKIGNSWLIDSYKPQYLPLKH